MHGLASPLIDCCFSAVWLTAVFGAPDKLETKGENGDIFYISSHIVDLYC